MQSDENSISPHPRDDSSIEADTTPQESSQDVHPSNETLPKVEVDQVTQQDDWCGESDDDQIRLYHKGDVKEFQRYVALSYCWGKQRQSYETTKATLTSDIDTTRLEKTIQDAIRYTRELGIKYLWVDCLCIVQDDEVDKKEVIGNMRQISPR
ncbi:hypothetical protein G647_06891 [Cladophialophora carrionii CBS 160.54]|uniref:Heterokaryon incompatibility domain-containing protein n=1 Tax=Cladophialophora carrionii CBS 160.54 TaxID=1279043 RepID=V9D7F8_9EURO|nr:uncharacterized protein G647_06891 [Cladophialophora carrionii CBS 160.54]ETI22815.1 hypothetical protein G647_06891 [Cladophialophora carrionii CBS 160.54]